MLRQQLRQKPLQTRSAPHKLPLQTRLLPLVTKPLQMLRLLLTKLLLKRPPLYLKWLKFKQTTKN